MCADGLSQAIANNNLYSHPGYGFLAENAQFAAAVRDAGIECMTPIMCLARLSVLIVVVVGPSTDVLCKMGDKVTARRIAQSCNIPIIPGTEGPVQDLQDAHEFVTRLVTLRKCMVIRLDGGTLCSHLDDILQIWLSCCCESKLWR